VWSKTDERRGERRRLLEELYDLYSAANVIWVIESRRMNWVKQMARMMRFRWGKPEGKRPHGSTGSRREEIL
jgi:hypothetical protein